MPKALSLGNEHILVLIDKFARVRDIYFPYVGLENHVGSRFAHKLGVFTDNQFSWFDDGTWDVDVRADESFAGDTLAHHPHLAVKLRFEDVVSNEKNIFFRKVTVTNESDRSRAVKVFFNHQFGIYSSEEGDTAFYDPMTGTVIHYEGKRTFLMNVRMGDHGFDDYTTGVFQLEGKEGTFRDAEDGMLAKNPIEHGRVDSTIGVTLTMAPGETQSFYYWMCVGLFIKDVKELNTYVLDHGAEYLMKTVRDYWSAWVNRRLYNFHGLSQDMVDLFKKSILTIKSHLDSGGAVIASGDSDMLQGGRDTYSYMWPRDGAFVTAALDEVGDRHAARKFFEFATSVLSDDGYFMHKYRPDQSLGSSWHPWIVNGKTELPIQEDETALVLWALWEHYRVTKDLEFVESLYHSFIKPAGLFLMSHRNPYTGLPKPSYNLWEENFGIHTFTAAATYGGLMAASRFAGILGKTRSETNLSHTAEEMRTAILKHCWDEEGGFFYRTLSVADDGQLSHDNAIDSSSAYGVMAFGVLPTDDERLVRSFKAMETRLTIPGVGGLARYENDQYFRTTQNVTGNPWFITTLWLAQFYIARAKNEADMEKVKDIFQWVVNYALPSGILSEQIDPTHREPVSAAPLTWSHAEYVRTVILYLKRLVDLGIIKDYQLSDI